MCSLKHLITDIFTIIFIKIILSRSAWNKNSGTWEMSPCLLSIIVSWGRESPRAGALPEAGEFEGARCERKKWQRHSDKNCSSVSLFNGIYCGRTTTPGNNPIYHETEVITSGNWQRTPRSARILEFCKSVKARSAISPKICPGRGAECLIQRTLRLHQWWESFSRLILFLCTCTCALLLIFLP